MAGGFKNSTVGKRTLFNTWQRGPAQNIAPAFPVLLQRADMRSPRQQYGAPFIVFSMFPVSILSRSLINVARWHVSRGQQWYEDTTLYLGLRMKMQMMKLNLKVMITPITSAVLHLLTVWSFHSCLHLWGHIPRSWELHVNPCSYVSFILKASAFFPHFISIQLKFI